MFEYIIGTSKFYEAIQYGNQFFCLNNKITSSDLSSGTFSSKYTGVDYRNSR